VLITDGAPFCNDACIHPTTMIASGNDPDYTACEIEKAAVKNIKTFVVGFGALAGSEQAAMNTFATAGQEPCMGASCNGKLYYVADSPASLQAAIDAITSTIAVEFSGGQCDDSCYSNGCPNVGEICVMGKCKADPCASLTTCAPGDYCYTDGNSPGTCIKACDKICPEGEVCTASGICQQDLCATLSCGTDEACKDGNCVPNKCGAMGCLPGFICFQGSCIDDPCRYVTTNGKPGCPDGHTCVPGTGACAASLTSGGGPGGGRRGAGGCDFSIGASSATLLAAFALLAFALVLRARRRN
jgi:hypothetical protein